MLEDKREIERINYWGRPIYKKEPVTIKEPEQVFKEFRAFMHLACETRKKLKGIE